MAYGRFVTMIAVSTVIMFGLMYLNTFALDHVWYSQTRTWMALLMGAVMAAVMLAFMWGMYRNRTANLAILAASAVVFAVSLWLVRSQQTVTDVAYMEAMIPHHSIARFSPASARTSEIPASASWPTTSSKPRCARSARWNG
ncbi:NADH:ubiquinone oxidoreductase subunit K [Bradyrhizobium sp. F1.13.4]